MHARLASLLVALLVTTMAHAADAPDLVRLKDGGMLRGTIIELVPGKAVDILLVGGERRSIDMATVEYAGPADRAPVATGPATPPPNVPVPPFEEMVRVRVEAKIPNIQLVRRVGTSTLVIATRHGGASGVAVNWQDLCAEMPCEVSLPVGTHTDLGLASAPFPIVEMGPVTITPTTQRLEAAYDGHAKARIGLGVVAGVLLVTSLALIVEGASSRKTTIGSDMQFHDSGGETLVPGVVLFPIAGVLGMVAMLWPPTASLASQ